MNYDSLLFSELRLIAIDMAEKELDNDSLLRAMTVNEELLAMGYTFSPKGIVSLAGSDSMTGLVSRVREYIGDVPTDPMYPGFPEQVMFMSEATFRFHQLLHYLSTYGIEQITGAKVRRGWLPDMETAERSKPDDTLLAAKVLGLIDEKEKYIIPYRKILSKTERMTDKERMIVQECCVNLSPEELTSVAVTFKQNLLDVFNTIFVSAKLEAEQKLSLLHALCQHTGDVWKCMDYSLTQADFHFKTSQKRLIVKLLESYPISDFRGNLIISNKKGERTALMLKYLDYNAYSRKPEYAKAVAELRSGKLRSWEARAKYLVEQGLLGALDYYAERPGMMLRALTYLRRNGYKIVNITDKLVPHAGELKTQTLVSLAAHFSQPESAWETPEAYQEALELQPVAEVLLQGRLYYNETPLKGKKVYIDDSEFDLAHSELRITDKSGEGGYMRSGIAYKIPKEATRIRFFVYWNDSERVDIDLHATATELDGNETFIGWNQHFKSDTVVSSGDITHSDAAEYIDIDLVKGKGQLSRVTFNIHLFAGYGTFKEIDECFVGIMAVGKCGEDIKLYNAKNCFFTHHLTSKCETMNYGYVDVENEVLVFDGTPTEKRGSWYHQRKHNTSFSLEDYLTLLFRAQNVRRVSTCEEAELVLVMGKPNADNEISMIDSNFFME